MWFVGCCREKWDESIGEGFELRFGGWFENGELGQVYRLTWLRLVFYYGGFVGCITGFGAKADTVEQVLGVFEIGLLLRLS